MQLGTSVLLACSMFGFVFSHHAMEECVYESLCSQELSVKIRGAYHYLRHPKQDIYLAAIYGRAFSFYGDSAKAAWDALNGFTTMSARVLSRIAFIAACSCAETPNLSSVCCEISDLFGTPSSN